jgi:hypothetical protein
MQDFSKTVYVVIFTHTKKEPVIMQGLEALARFASNDLYRVEGVAGRELTEVELNEWERLTDLLFDVVTLPMGLNQIGHA